METTLVKGLSLLEALANAPGGCGVTDLGRQLQITKSNAHRLLQTLVSCGYARNLEQSGRYELSLKLWQLGSMVIGRLDLKTIGAEYIGGLSQVTGETVHLSILEGTEVVYIDKVDSPHPIRAYSQVGGRAPAYCVATGKALLAHAPVPVIDAISLQLEPITAKTITSPRGLRAEMESIRANGYAVNQGEWREGVCGVAAPICDASGRVCAAIGISGPSDRFKPRRIKQLAPTVVKVAQQISARLGHLREVDRAGSRSAPAAAMQQALETGYHGLRG